VVVAPLGPPPVIKNSNSKLLKTHIVLNTINNPMTLRICLKVIFVNDCHALAPSITAASYCSFGIVFNAERMLTIKNGEPNQIFINTTVPNTSVLLDKKSTFALVIPIVVNKFGITPETSFNNHFHEKPITIVGNAQGMMSKTLNNPENFGSLLSVNAAINPTTTCPIIDKTVHFTEIHNAS